MATSNDTAAMLCHDHHNPPPASPTYLHSWDNICFLHPGYVDGANRLLSFPRVDLTRQGSSQYGVHHRTALVACQIIGGNAFSGYLALDSKGEKKAHHDTDLDGILMEKEYYFIVPGEDCYAVVPAFKDWQFPHFNMPDGWLDTELPNDRAKRCGVTSSGYGFKEAHLAPSEMEEWYARNDMRRYGADISKDYNTFPLRSDLHFLFDKRLAFVIAPKQRRVPPATSSTETPGNSAETAGTSAETRKADWVLHVIHTDGSEIWPEHHNTVVRSLHPQAQPYLLARLAWAVIPDVKGFLTASFDRKVVRLKASPSSGYEEVIIAGAALMDAYGGGGDKAAKPKTPGSSSRKRRKTGSIPGEKGDSIDGSSDNSGDDSDFWDDVGSEAVHTMRKVSCERAPDDTSNGQKLRREVEMELRNSAMGIVE